MWRVVLLLGVLAACSTYGEGSVTDWGALRLHGLGAGLAWPRSGTPRSRWPRPAGGWPGAGCWRGSGSGPCWCRAGSPPARGCSCAAFAPSIPVVVAGFALAGLGVANAFPAAMTRVGLLAGPHGVAIASTLGYGGFLLGPPTIGFLAGDPRPRAEPGHRQPPRRGRGRDRLVRDRGRRADSRPNASMRRPGKARTRRAMPGGFGDFGNPQTAVLPPRSAATPAPFLAPTSSPHPRTPICDGACSRPLTGRPLCLRSHLTTTMPSAAIAFVKKL